MATIISDRVYTPDDLRHMPEGERFELVNGQLVEREMGAFACWIVSLINAKLTTFVVEHSLGMVFSSETQYQCFADDPRRIRKPDVSYVQRGRITPEMMHGYVRLAPDLVVEVVSDNDLYYEVETKVREFLLAGVRVVWVLNPATNSVRVHRAVGNSTDLSSEDRLTGEDVLPGFSVSVGELFPALPGEAG